MKIECRVISPYFPTYFGYIPLVFQVYNYENIMFFFLSSYDIMLILECSGGGETMDKKYYIEIPPDFKITIEAIPVEDG